MQPENELPAFMTPDDVAAALQITVPAARLLMRRQDFPSFLVSPKKRRVKREEFLQWAKVLAN